MQANFPAAVIVGVLLTLAAPAWARGTETPLARAGVCYGQGNMSCVIDTLDAAAVPAEPKNAAEHWRMLALAAARMDRHDVAKRAFVAWIRLDPQRHRLDRTVTRPATYRSYAAAWLVVNEARLDLTPKSQPTPAPLPGPVTAGDLPRFSPPPRSKRDNRDDTVMAVGAAIAPLQGGDVVGWAGLGLSLERLAGARTTFGLRGAVFGRGHGVTETDVRTGIAYAALAFGYRLGAQKTVNIAGLLGAATMPDTFVGGVSVRYDARGLLRRWSSGVRPFADVTALYAADALLGQPLVVVSLGVMIGGTQR